MSSTMNADTERQALPTQQRKPLRLDLLDRHPNFKNHFIAAVGEFAGTTLFLLFALGGTNVSAVVSNGRQLDTSQLLYIALCFGFSLTINAWVFFRISGGLFNPAVSLALALVGAISPLRAAILTFSQMLGSIVAPALVKALVPGDLQVQTTLAPGINLAQGVFIEAFLTSMLILTIFLLAAEKHRATFLAPIGIGLSLFVAELMGVHWTGGSLNPARSFGPAVVARHFYPEHWVYWVGPCAGAVFSAGFYKFMKIMKYDTVNPYIDDDHVHPVSTATKAALAFAGLAIDEKTGAVMSAGMSRGGTAMSRLGNRSAIGGVAPVPEGTGLGDLFGPPAPSAELTTDGEFSPFGCSSTAGPTIVIPASSIDDGKMAALEEKLDFLIAQMQITRSGSAMGPSRFETTTEMPEAHDYARVASPMDGEAGAGASLAPSSVNGDAHQGGSVHSEESEAPLVMKQQ